MFFRGVETTNQHLFWLSQRFNDLEPRVNYWVHMFMYSLYSPVWDDVRRLQITPPPVNGRVVECRKTKENMLCQFLPKKTGFLVLIYMYIYIYIILYIYIYILSLGEIR